MLNAIVSPLRGKAPPRSQSFPVNSAMASEHKVNGVTDSTDLHKPETGSSAATNTLVEVQRPRTLSDLPTISASDIARPRTATGLRDSSFVANAGMAEVNGPAKETATGGLFYAYAKRVRISAAFLSHGNMLIYNQTDHALLSRYILTFENADVCGMWWELVQQEYPKQGVRSGPQLFAFKGHAFPYKPATNKKFEHLHNKWFYTQIGDADGSGSKAIALIPQSGSAAPLGTQLVGETPGLTESLDKLRVSLEKTADGNAEQVKALAEGQIAGQDVIKELVEKLDKQSETQERISRALEQVAERSSERTQISTTANESHGQEALLARLDAQTANQEKILHALEQNLAQPDETEEEDDDGVEVEEKDDAEPTEDYFERLTSELQKQSASQDRLIHSLEEHLSDSQRSSDQNLSYHKQVTILLNQLVSQATTPKENKQMPGQYNVLKGIQAVLERSATQMRDMADEHAQQMRQMQRALEQNNSQIKLLVESQHQLISAFTGMLQHASSNQQRNASYNDGHARGESLAQGLGISHGQTPSQSSFAGSDGGSLKSPPRKLGPKKLSRPNMRQSAESQAETPKVPKLPANVPGSAKRSSGGGPADPFTR